jgi:mannose-6-phosphate isomerase
MPPLIFEPYYRPQVWGGRRFVDLGRTLPDDQPYGESWDVSAHRHHVSRVAEGPFKGTLLTDLWREHASEMWGAELSAGTPFPLLIKVLDCERPLSVQVHPDDETARRHWPHETGKAEAWVVLEAAPTARIHTGFKAGVTRDCLLQHLDAGTVAELLNSYVPQVGDCIQVRPGTVHAIEGGVLLVEVQQSSDATLRLFDWNRLGLDGRPRELHVDEALVAIDWSLGPVHPRRQLESISHNGGVRELCVDDLHFRLDRIRSHVPIEVADSHRLSIWTVLTGHGVLRHRPSNFQRHFQRGDTVMLPASDESPLWEPQGELELLKVTAPTPVPIELVASQQTALQQPCCS